MPTTQEMIAAAQANVVGNGNSASTPVNPTYPNTLAGMQAQAAAGGLGTMVNGVYNPGGSGVSQPMNGVPTVPQAGPFANQYQNVNTPTVPGSAPIAYAPGVTPQGNATASDPRVIAYMKQFPGTNVDVAIGSVNMGWQPSQPVPTITSGVAATNAQQNVNELNGMTNVPITNNPTSPTTAANAVTSGNVDPGVAQADADINYWNAQHAQYLAKSDAQNLQMIEMIRQKAIEQRDMQKNINANRLAASEIIGSRTGRQRYAPTLFHDAQEKERAAGVAALRKIDTEEQGLILQAAQAKTESDWKALNDNMTMIRALRKDKQDLIQQQFDNANKTEMMSIQQAQESRAKTAEGRQERKDLLADLETMGKTGVTLSDEELKVFDSLIGYKDGFSKSAMEFASQSQKVATEKDKMAAASSYIDMASKIDVGDTYTTPNGITISGLRVVDPLKGIDSFRETDLDGNVTEITTTFDPVTGQRKVLDITEYPSIGKKNTTTPNTPTSYDEWVLAGKPGTYAEYLQGKKGSNRPLPATQAMVLSEGFQLPLVLDSLTNIIDTKGNLFGPVRGLIGSANPYAEETQKIEDDLRRAAQVVGKYMEGGVLRAEDEKKYKKMLPQITDTPAVAKNKLEGVATLLAQKSQSYLDDFESAGFDVSGYKGRLPGTQVDEVGGLKTPDPTLFPSPLEFIEATKGFNGADPNVSPFKPSLDEVLDFYASQGVENPPAAEFNQKLKEVMQRKGVDFNQDLSMSQNSSTTGVSPEFIKKLAVTNPAGSRGGQCVTFLHTIAAFPRVGDTRQEKFRAVNKYGVLARDWQPQTGDIIITGESDKWGHGAMVNEVNLEEGTITLTESNYKGNERVTNTRKMAINSPKIYGAIKPDRFKA